MRTLLHLLFIAMFSVVSTAATTDYGIYVNYTGVGVNDEDVLIQTGELDRYDACNIRSNTGSVEVLTQMTAGGPYGPTAHSLDSQGATSITIVQATVAGTTYLFVGKFKTLRVQQVGATATTVELNCWKS